MCGVAISRHLRGSRRLRSPATASLELESEVVFDSERGCSVRVRVGGFEGCLPGRSVLGCSRRGGIEAAGGVDDVGGVAEQGGELVGLSGE